jgi:hypothetical protein
MELPAQDKRRLSLFAGIPTTQEAINSLKSHQTPGAKSLIELSKFVGHKQPASGRSVVDRRNTLPYTIINKM